MVEGGVGGSDESFISFAFAVTSVALIVLYIPWIISKVRRALVYYRSPKKDQALLENPAHELADSLLYIPRVLRSLAKDPQVVVAGAKVCMKEKVFFVRCVMPKFLKFVIRPRIFVPILWVFLFSSAMYATLTFNPHEVLGISSSASLTDIKRAYRTLSKRYHPDHNTTEAAREIYVQVRRAYKALVDRDAFDEEEAKNVQEFGVGVALPRFLTSRENDGLVLFGLLGVLIGVPFIFWYRFTNNKKLPRLVWRIRFDKSRIESFLRLFGIPEDAKYVERRESRRATLQTLISVGVVPPNMREDVVNVFPPFPEFARRCVEKDRYKVSIMQLGLDEQALEALHEYFVNNGTTALEAYESRVAAACAGCDTISLVDTSTFRATRYLFQQHTQQVDEALVELQELMGGNLPSVRKLLNLHEEIYNLLDAVYATPDKPNKPTIAKLTAMPQRVSDAVDNVEPEIQLVYRRYYKNYMTQVEAMNKQRRQLQKTSESAAPEE